MDIYYFIDRIKGLCHVHGLSNQAAEEETVRNLFLYKILCDRFDPNKEITAGGLKMEECDLIIHAGKRYTWLNETWQRINQYEGNDKWQCKLFSPIMEYLNEKDRQNFYEGIIEIFSESTVLLNEDGDHFRVVFEYLIQDYNVSSGRYAEYYTPVEISDIISRILTYENDQRKGLRIYDPSAGTGTLLLSLKQCCQEPMIYAQDISGKSVELLYLNFLLNGAKGRVYRGNTLSDPHFSGPFDYIVSNPPFKTDFSFIHEELSQSGKFPFGVPAVPNKKKESMSIYLCFIQHVLNKLDKDGKAAVVIPLNFLSNKGEIELSIRKYVIENKILEGVLVMPNNTFANTGTKVGIIFLNKKGCEGAVLYDASDKGMTVKKGKGKRVTFTEKEADEIVNQFLYKKDSVGLERIKEKGYSFLPGLYEDPFAQRTYLSDQEWEVKKAEFAHSFLNLLQQENYWNTQLEEIFKVVR